MQVTNVTRYDNVDAAVLNNCTVSPFLVILVYASDLCCKFLPAILSQYYLEHLQSRLWMPWH